MNKDSPQSSLYGDKLADGKTIRGKVGMTLQVIVQLTECNGRAIHAHSNCVENMQDTIRATFYHKRLSR